MRKYTKRTKQRLSEKTNSTDSKTRKENAIEGIFEVLCNNGISSGEAIDMLNICAANIHNVAVQEKSGTATAIEAPEQKTPRSPKRPEPNTVTIAHMKRRLLAAVSDGFDKWWEEIKEAAENSQGGKKT